MKQVHGIWLLYLLFAAIGLTIGAVARLVHHYLTRDRTPKED